MGMNSEGLLTFYKTNVKASPRMLRLPDSASSMRTTRESLSQSNEPRPE